LITSSFFHSSEYDLRPRIKIAGSEVEASEPDSISTRSNNAASCPRRRIDAKEFEVLADEQLIEVSFFRDDGPDLDRYHLDKILPKGLAILAQDFVAEPDPLRVAVGPPHKSVYMRIFEGTRSGLWDLIKIAFGAVWGWYLRSIFRDDGLHTNLTKSIMPKAKHKPAPWKPSWWPDWKNEPLQFTFSPEETLKRAACVKLPKIVKSRRKSI